MSIKPLAKTSDILVQQLENELLVYDLKTNKAFCLNETSAMIYQLCDGAKTTADISNLMSRKLKTPVPKDFISLALDSFKKEDLLEESERIEIDFNGLTRRQVIKQVGLASLIALPIVSSVVAPSAVLAFSCVTSGNPAPGAIITCTSSGIGACNSSCNLNNSGQCCSMQAQLSRGLHLRLCLVFLNE